MIISKDDLLFLQKNTDDIDEVIALDDVDELLDEIDAYIVADIENNDGQSLTKIGSELQKIADRIRNDN